MAREPTQAQLYEELLDRYGPKVAAAFLAAMDDFRAAADLQRAITAIAAGNIEAAIAALNLDAAALSELQLTLQEIYLAGGQAGVASMPRIRDAAGAVVVIRFDGRNIAAEDWLRRASSELITRIVDEQRAVIRTYLDAGMRRGDNPRRTALDIVGRVNRATGKREGGVLGLNGPQEEYVRTARDELESSDPTLLKHYLTRARRDKRYDRTIQRTINEIEAGNAKATVPTDIAVKALTRYEARLLQLRGEMIGRKETMTALQAAKHQAYVQAVARGAVAAGAIRRTWRDSSDLRVRHTHRRLDGETVGLNEPFVSPSGARMMYPGDTSLGAPASEVVGCRCDVEYRIDFLANVR